MARTFGGASTDAITTDITAHNTTRSYAMWVYRTGTGGGGLGRMFDKRTGADAQVEQLYLANVGTTYSFEREWSGGPSEWTFTAPALNEWHHVAVTYDAGSSANDPVMYLDGVSQSVSVASRGSGTPNTNTSGYVLGNRTNDNARNWAGGIAEFAIWNVILTAAEVAILAGAKELGHAPDLVQNGNLAGYWPLRGDANEPNRITAGNSTLSGTVVSKGPDWIFPGPKQVDRRNFVYMRRNF